MKTYDCKKKEWVAGYRRGPDFRRTSPLGLKDKDDIEIWDNDECDVDGDVYVIRGVVPINDKDIGLILGGNVMFSLTQEACDAGCDLIVKNYKGKISRKKFLYESVEQYSIRTLDTVR